MIPTLLFAMNYRAAEVDYLQYLDGASRKGVVVVTSNEAEYRIRGRRYGRAVFLDGWFRGWNPREADEILGLLHVYGVEEFWERDDIGRRNFARGQMGLPASQESQFVWYHLPTIMAEFEDSYWGSVAAFKWRRLLKNDAARAEREQEPRRLSALPGLDDKPKRKNPVGGVVFKEIFDIEDPDGAYPLYADWFIRRSIRQPKPYRDFEEERAARRWREALIYDYMRMKLATGEDISLLKGFSVV